jgi:hypothetical protein
MKRAIAALLAAGLIAICLWALSYGWYYVDSALARQRQHGILARLHDGESIEGVRRLASEYGLAWGQPVWPNTQYFDVAYVGVPFSPCSDTYFVDVVFEAGKVARFSPRQGHSCM